MAQSLTMSPVNAREVSQWTLIWRQFKRNGISILGACIVLAVILIAIFAPVLAPNGYTDQELSRRREPPSLEHPLGFDELGRSIQDRLIWGARISMMAGLVSVVLGMGIGVLIGLLTAYLGGWVDMFLMRVVDIILAIPFFLWGIVVVSALTPSLMSVMIAIGTWMIPSYARIVRSQALAVRENLYVEAARSVGIRDARIIALYVLPNVMGPITVETSLRVGSAILAEAALSFLGLGVPAPEPSWGAMLLGGRQYMRTTPHISMFPGLAILITVLGFNLLGDGVRDVLDPKLRG